MQHRVSAARPCELHSGSCARRVEAPTMTSASRKQYHLALLASFVVILIWSVIRPKELFTWFLESFPAMIGAVILLATYRRFQWTTLVYTLIWMHAIIL